MTQKPSAALGLIYIHDSNTFSCPRSHLYTWHRTFCCPWSHTCAWPKHLLLSLVSFINRTQTHSPALGLIYIHDIEPSVPLGLIHMHDPKTCCPWSHLYKWPKHLLLPLVSFMTQTCIYITAVWRMMWGLVLGGKAQFSQHESGHKTLKTLWA